MGDEKFHGLHFYKLNVNNVINNMLLDKLLASNKHNNIKRVLF